MSCVGTVPGKQQDFSLASPAIKLAAKENGHQDIQKSCLLVVSAAKMVQLC